MQKPLLPMTKTFPSTINAYASPSTLTKPVRGLTMASATPRRIILLLWIKKNSTHVPIMACNTTVDMTISSPGQINKDLLLPAPRIYKTLSPALMENHSLKNKNSIKNKMAVILKTSSKPPPQTRGSPTWPAVSSLTKRAFTTILRPLPLALI